MEEVEKAREKKEDERKERGREREIDWVAPWKRFFISSCMYFLVANACA